MSGAKRLAPVLVLLSAWAAAAHAGPREVLNRYRSAVVAVSYYVETSFMREVREVGGRDVGIIVDRDLVMLNGSVLTSSSTGARPHSFEVRFEGGEEVQASLVGRDEFVNVAFLRLDGPLPDYVKPLRFGPVARLQVGDPVVVLGLLPENLEPMVRLWSGRVVAHVERPKDFDVTDLPVQEALGGPVFTANGKLVGVLSELGGAGPSFASGFSDGAEEAGSGLILAAEMLAGLVAEPPRQGEARRSWLGITLQALDRDMAEYWGLGSTTGIIVNSVVTGSPAEAAGLQEGDLVVSLNGAPIPVSLEEHVPIFVEQVGSTPVGSRMQLGVIRKGKRFEASVDLVAAPKTRLDAEDYHSSEFDLTVRELVFQDYRAFDLEPDFKGVLVSRVEEGGWAGVGGLESGDIIQKVDDRDINSPAELKDVLDQAVRARQRKLVFFVRRSGRTQFITVQPNWNGES